MLVFFALNYKKSGRIKPLSATELDHLHQMCSTFIPENRHVSELLVIFIIVNMHWLLFHFYSMHYITQCLIIYLKG